MNWFPPCRIVAHKHMACQQQGLTPALRALLTHHALICLVAIKVENPKYEHVQTLSTEAHFMHYFFGERNRSVTDNCSYCRSIIQLIVLYHRMRSFSIKFCIFVQISIMISVIIVELHKTSREINMINSITKKNRKSHHRT